MTGLMSALTAGHDSLLTVYLPVFEQIAPGAFHFNFKVLSACTGFCGFGLRMHDFVSDSIWLACKNSPDYACRFATVGLRRAQTFAGVASNYVFYMSDRQIFADKIGILRHAANTSATTYNLS